MKFGSMSIATTNESGISRKKWLHGQWTDNAQDFWDDFVEDGKYMWYIYIKIRYEVNKIGYFV